MTRVSATRDRVPSAALAASSGRATADPRGAAGKTALTNARLEPQAPLLQRQEAVLGSIENGAGTAAQASLIRRLIGPPPAPGRPAPIQRAGDYSGLLPDHDAEGGSYKYGDDDREKKEFTYHHIIPENILNKAYLRIKAVLEKTQNAEGGDAQGLRDGAEGLKAGARELWLNTRAKNTAAAINANFSDYGVSVAPDDLRPLLKDNTTLDALFPLVRDLIKGRLRSKLGPTFNKLRAALADRISEKLKEAEFVKEWRNKNTLASVQEILQPLALAKTPLFDAAEVVAIIDETPVDGTRGTNKGELVRKIGAHALDKTFDGFYARAFPELVEKSSKSTYLMQNVKEKGLPRMDQDELKDAMEWNPGNIHRGPKSSYRLNPEAAERFEALRDDGGDAFEYAAVNLVGTEHFAKLEKLGRDITAFLADEAENPGEETVRLAAQVVEQMRAIQAFGVTSFDPFAWEKHGKDKMRVKRHEGRLGAASGIASIHALLL